MKKKLMVTALALMLAFVGAAATACSTDQPEGEDGDMTSGYTGKVEGIKFTLPALGGKIELLTPLQKRASKETPTYIGSIARGTTESSRPQPVNFNWQASGVADGAEYTLSVRENKDMSDAWVYKTVESDYKVYNLKIGTKYYWTVTVNGVQSGVATFTTNSTPARWLFVDGITNVRDLGGYTTDTGIINQGLVYRCGRLNASWAENVTAEITESGKAEMLDRLGVKTEIDLRLKGEVGGLEGATAGVLGEGVNYYHCPLVSDDYLDERDDILKNNKKGVDNKVELKKIFDIFGQRENYPIIFHCNIGTDRTGCIAFIINALCGADINDLYRDYMLSNLGKIGSGRELSNVNSKGKYMYVLQNYEKGETLAEKTYNYLVDELGVSTSTLDSIISIMTTPANR